MLYRILVGIFSLCAAANGAFAQQPFYVDDADVAAYHRWHLESNNEYDTLSARSYPSLHQDTQTVKFSYGVFGSCEVGMDFPLIAIYNSPASGLGTPFGFGDTDFSVKYNFHREAPESSWPAMTASLNIEPPTGNARLKLGSGITDYYLNTIFQKTLSPKNVLRLNLGATFVGNTLTGVVGINTRGTTITGGASFVRQLTPKLDLGVEVYGGHALDPASARNELQQQVGGNYEIRKRLSVDFGFIAGQATGSPRHGFQLGLSKDF